MNDRINRQVQRVKQFATMVRALRGGTVVVHVWKDRDATCASLLTGYCGIVHGSPCITFRIINEGDGLSVATVPETDPSVVKFWEQCQDFGSRC